ncbi:MAG TPA: LysR family transcriptional regulator [Kofleriaceae bacterium]
MDGFAEIGVFTRVVDAHSFTLAATSLGITPSGVSRIISRLEQRLGTRLLQRTTRSLSLTDDGAAYYERCKRILVELEDAESAIASTQREPRGRLRVDAPIVVGQHLLAPVLPAFLSAHPQLSLDLSVRDHIIDPTAEGVDITLRMAALRDSDLVARTLGLCRMVTVGAPKYFAKHGRPKHPRDLAKHRVIGFWSEASGAKGWRFRDGEFAIDAQLTTNSGDAQVAAALAGFGLIHVFEFHVREELARKRLEIVLAGHEPAPRPLSALYARHRAATPKLRVFLDWVENVVSGR